MDNYATHKTVAVRAWPERRPYWHVHFTPTSSWINQVERWFAELTCKQLQRGVHTSTFPKKHRTKLHSTNAIQHLKGEIKRRTDVVGIFPNDNAIVRLVGALLLEQNDEWAVQRARYMTLETISQMSGDLLVSLPAVAR